MKIVKAKRNDIVVEIDGAKLTFGPSSHQDIIYAANLLDNLTTKGMSITPVDRDTCIKHIFAKLKAVEGVKSDDKELSVQELKDLAPQAEASSITPIIGAWAVEICKAEGFFPEVEEKKELTDQPVS